jgi:hypothetical protein
MRRLNLDGCIEGDRRLHCIQRRQGELIRRFSLARSERDDHRTENWRDQGKSFRPEYACLNQAQLQLEPAHQFPVSRTEFGRTPINVPFAL